MQNDDKNNYLRILKVDKHLNYLKLLTTDVMRSRKWTDKGRLLTSMITDHCYDSGKIQNQQLSARALVNFRRKGTQL